MEQSLILKFVCFLQFGYYVLFLTSHFCRNAASTLQSYYDSVLQSTVSWLECMNPFKTSFTFNSTTLNLMYEQRYSRQKYLACLAPNNLLDTQKPVFVKFTKSYSQEFHHYMANLGLAPTLYCCQRITNYEKYFSFCKVCNISSYYMVVMEIAVGKTLNDFQTEGLDEVLETHKNVINIVFFFIYKLNKKLLNALQKAHQDGFVHGDLRPPNIIITSNGPQIIDFDWGGKIGIAHYPVDINPEVDWPEGKTNDMLLKRSIGVEPGGKIAAEHDMWLLNQSFNKVLKSRQRSAGSHETNTKKPKN